MKGREFFQIRTASATCVLALIALPVFFSILLLGSSHLAHAQGMGNERHATGLILMNSEESEFFRMTHSRVEGVRPNKIALDRINNARAKKGQPPLPESSAASPGQELVFSGDAGVSGDGDLPVRMDNSDFKWFPPIGNQGGLGSCTTFATTYYQLTYTVGRIRHPQQWDQTVNPPNYDIIFSPRWTFNFQRNSENAGSSFWGNYNVLQNNGACTWNEFPYIGDKVPPENYRAWCPHPDAWEHAIYYRINPISYILDVDPVAIKSALNNGNLITFGTYVSNWQYTKIKDNKYSNDDKDEVRKYIAYWVNGELGGHAMTIVGYNDVIWADVNGNREIDAEIDPETEEPIPGTGELGAFRIANSWGTNSNSLAARDDGFAWLAYDALKADSGIVGGPSEGRVPAFPERHVYIMTVKTEYTPKLLAKFELDHVKRNQLIVHLGVSGSGITETSPSISWYPGMFNLSGGEYAFDGTTNPNCDAIFVLDFTDILLPGSAGGKYYLGVSDIVSGDLAALSYFQIKDVLNGATGYHGNVNEVLPIYVDAGEAYASIDYPFVNNSANHPPLAVISASPTSGTVPLSVHFDGSGSSDFELSELKYVWNFGSIQYSAIGVGEIIESPDYIYEDPGIYCAKLTVTDDMGASSSAIVLIYAEMEPPDTTPPAAVTNLAAGSPASSSIILTWTAPGDDGNTDTASQYDIRYSTSPITASNWEAATECDGEPPPLLAGSPESFTVTGLASSTPYYFALKTGDEVPNCSDLSNSPDGETLEASSLFMHVSDIDMSLKVAGLNVTASATVTILDASDAPVSGATVSGTWSGATKDLDSGVTDIDGKVKLNSDTLKRPSDNTVFTFTVDNVVKAEWTYDDGANVEYSDSTTYPPSAAPALARATGLENAYPILTNPEIWIPFTLSEPERVVIKIYDVTGRLVRTLKLGEKSPGAYLSKEKAAYWDGRNENGEKVTSGIYFYLMEAGSFRAVKKMVISR